MYTIRVDRLEEALIEVTEIMEHIEMLHKKYQTLVPKTLVLKHQRGVYLEIGIGDREERSYIIYERFLEPEKDCLIAFNPSVSVTDQTMISLFEWNGIKQERWIRNLIPFNKVMNEVQYYLSNECLSEQLRWHAY